MAESIRESGKICGFRDAVNSRVESVKSQESRRTVRPQQLAGLGPAIFEHRSTPHRVLAEKGLLLRTEYVRAFELFAYHYPTHNLCNPAKPPLVV